MIDINRVYEKVLFLANKDQRGYITPDEFNSYAHQAQLEVFESYFLKKFQANQAPMTTDDYSDVAMNVDEKIELFTNQSSVTKTDRVFTYPTNFYRLAHVSVAGSQGFPIMADEISHRDAHYVNLSPLTRPTASQPVFTRYEGGVIVFPETITEGVTMTYVRTPVTPVWGFGYMQADMTLGPMPDPMAPTEEPLYDSSTSTNFELHQSDEQELVYKILSMAGVTIKQPDITGYGQGKEQQIAGTEG